MPIEYQASQSYKATLFQQTPEKPINMNLTNISNYLLCKKDILFWV